MVAIADVFGRIRASVVSKVKEHRRRKEELRRVYEEEYRKALIKAMKEKARKRAREKAFSPSPFERIWGAIIRSRQGRRARTKRTFDYTPGWAKYNIIDRSTGPNPWAGLTSKRKKPRRGWMW